MSPIFVLPVSIIPALVSEIFEIQYTLYRITHLSAIETSDIMIYTVETSDIRRGEAESDIILARLNKSPYTPSTHRNKYFIPHKGKLLHKAMHDVVCTAIGSLSDITSFIRYLTSDMEIYPILSVLDKS